MNESFRIGVALLLKTLYKNDALVKYHLVSKFSQSRVRRTSADSEIPDVPKFYTERFKNSYVIASCLNINNCNSTN